MNFPFRACFSALSVSDGSVRVRAVLRSVALDLRMCEVGLAVLKRFASISNLNPTPNFVVSAVLKIIPI